MTTTDAITLLRTYNKWRRGDESIEQPNPTEIGVAIDTVLNSLENATQDHAQADTDTLRALKERNDALLQLGSIQSLVAEVFDLDRTPTTTEEIRAVLERNAGSGIHTCHKHCNRPACVLRRERDQLARWKQEQLTVESWWQEIDKAVREHPDTILGDTIAHTALRFIRERDEAIQERDQYASILCDAMKVVYATQCHGDSTDLIDRFEALELTPGQF